MRFLIAKFCFFTEKIFGALSRCFHDLPCVLLPLKDLSELNRRYYNRSDIVAAWKENAKAGLSVSEEEFINKFLSSGDKVCVVGCGAGRELIGLISKGLAVEGFDVSQSLVAAAKESPILADKVSVGSFQSLKGQYKAIFLGTMYGAIPTKKQRSEILKQLSKYLLSGGAVYICGLYRPISRLEKYRLGLWKVLGLVFLGNRAVELGDCIIDDGEFFHYFSSAKEITDEITSAGLKVSPSFDGEAFFVQV